MTPTQVEAQINRILTLLVREGLAVDQGFAYQRPVPGGLQEVTFRNFDEIPLATIRHSYVEGYRAVVRRRAYNLLLDNGAAMQMTYLFHGRELLRHRLAYLGMPPEPDDLGEALVEPLIGDIASVSEAGGGAPIGQPQCATTFRFDFDHTEHEPDAGHPRSHLTFSNLKACRIPVTSPLTPELFVQFSLDHFYAGVRPKLPGFQSRFPESITKEESGCVHLAIPNLQN